jgi:hypothetical protein
MTTTIGFINYILLIMMFGSFFYLLNYYLVRRIVITESGLEYREMFKCIYRSWDDLIIGVDWYSHNPVRVPLSLWIYFSENCDEDPKGDMAIYRAFLRVRYRKRIIDEISKYYSNEIRNAHLVEK